MLSANVLALGAVADFGAQNCQYTTKIDALTRPKISLLVFNYNPITSLHKYFNPEKYLRN
jgi:hypothetical protein